MTTHKKVPMTSKEALTLISMLSQRIEANKEDIANAPVIMNMKEELEENSQLEWIIEKLDRKFWDKNGELI